MVSVMAFTSRAPRLQTSADRYYRFFDEGQQIGVDLVVRSSMPRRQGTAQCSCSFSAEAFAR
jgi:hypothetical protein